jgi:hypothetical protein
LNPQPLIPEESETFIFGKMFYLTGDSNPESFNPEESVLATRLLKLVKV